jgi:DNA helicase-2/ATP-dependent DNA helicase PcrA
MILDNYQGAAAHSPDTKILISAAAGSGKTRTVAARVLYMIEELEMPPQSIVLLTFTRFAAREMKKRLGQWGSYLGFCGTFHAFALSIVQEFGSRRGWEGEWLTLLDEKEAELDEDEVLQEQGYITRQGKWPRFDPIQWKEFKEGLINGTRIPDPEDDTDKRMLTVWKGCMDRMRAQNVLTFGALVLEALALLEEPDVLEAVTGRYKHMIVDEGQDTDGSQWELLRLIDPETLCIVGDISQGIYKWRGAVPELFIQYGEDEATTYQLPNSYRFGFNIANPANNLITHAQTGQRIAINAIAENEGNLHVCRDVRHDELPGMIRKELEAGAEPDDIVVLARRHRTLDQVSRQLRLAEIPHTQIGGRFDVPKTAEYHVLKGYMRLAVNPRDRRAFMAVTASEHLSAGAILEIREKALAEGCSLVDAYTNKPENWPPQNLDDIEEHLTRTDLDRVYRPAFEYMRGVMEYEGFVTLGDTVRYLAMQNVQDKLRTTAGTVTCCTGHASKGLEWPVVFVVGLNSKQFPSPRSVGAGMMDEELNLAYVMITRAERTLYLIHHENESPDDKESVFLKWIEGEDDATD